jgi:hypothetical protein
MLESAGSSVAELRRELESFSYDVRWIDESARALRPFDDAQGSEYVNLRASPLRLD